MPKRRREALAMNDQQLQTTLRAVGMACFVRYYEHAHDASLAQRIRDADGYTTYRQRASEIRSIVVKHGRGKDALSIIASSDRVDAETRRKAAALLAQLCPRATDPPPPCRRDRRVRGGLCSGVIQRIADFFGRLLGRRKSRRGSGNDGRLCVGRSSGTSEPKRGREASAMSDQQLQTTLRAVGMACFVRYYERAGDPSLHQQIRDADGYSSVACRTRASGIRSIVVRYGRGKDALSIIANSDKVDAETRRKAAALLAQA